MRLILHILKKDMRRHWLEILISLVLLGFFVWVTVQGPNHRFVGNRFPWFQLTENTIPPLMIFFWIFLTVRVVQGETLVGDRQWWVTKPYEWWTLLAAKELFLVVCFGVPLFFVQLYLMHHAGFPVLHNTWGILTMQFELGFVLFLPSVALGSLAKGLGQALIGILVALIGFWATLTLLEKVPSSGMSSAVRSSDEITGVMVLASIVGTVIWQYARRRTWAARGLLVGGMGPWHCSLHSHLTPGLWIGNIRSSKQARRPHTSPLHRRSPIRKTKGPVRFHIRCLFTHAPVGIRYCRRTRRGSGWNKDHRGDIQRCEMGSGLEGAVGSILEGRRRQNGIYDAKRKAYEKLKKENVRLHIELALTEYQAEETRDLVIKNGEFLDAKLGICSLNERLSWQIDCRRPFRTPGLMATFDPTTAKCAAGEDAEDLPEEAVSHAWFAPHNDDSPDAGLNPVDSYPISFGSRRPFYPSGEKRKFKAVRLCPGAVVKLAKPAVKRHMRVKLDLDNVRLQDLLETGFDWD